MYRYVFDLFREQQEARNKALEYIYTQLPKPYDISKIKIVKQSNGSTTSVLYRGRLIGIIYEHYEGSTWYIDAERVLFDKEDEDESYEHLVDITCSWDEMDGFRNRKYAIGPGYSYEDLTEVEKKVIDLQKEDL